MSKLDQFESVFKSASKQLYTFEEVPQGSALVITDLSEEASRRFAADLREFLSALGEVEWSVRSGAVLDDVGDLLELIEAERPDLVCTYRNVHGPARTFPFSLGAHVDVLTQATTTPVLLLPPPTDEDRLAPSCRDTREVMVLTDHLTGSNQLVDFGVRFVEPDGKLVLAHLEDDSTFNRYIDVIGKIPSIDTDTAREAIALQLLKEPKDFIESCREVLVAQRPDLAVEMAVAMGHRVSDCKSLIEQHEIDLIVLNTKDEEQLAMHGLTYPLAVELRQVPLLML